MSKEKKLILVPLIIICCLLAYCWITILSTGILINWRHYLGLILFAVIVILYFKDLPKAVVATGIYLLVATFNGVAITPIIKTSWFRMGIFETPAFQLLSLGLFILYFILNLDTLINIYLDYKEAKQAKVQKEAGTEKV